MSEMITCGEATMRLLARYGVDTVFGIPGVHTLDFCRGLAAGPITHVQARNEQGAGFMADGYARTSGRPGVALVISGPGVTNALTPLGQSYADSVPVLLLSSDTASHTHGKGWGMLHEVTSLEAVSAPLTAFSATVRDPSEVPGLVARAFRVFQSGRPRPVHIAIPIDVTAQLVADEWQPVTPPPRPMPDNADIEAAASLLRDAERPLIMIGGGAHEAADALTALAEQLEAPVLASTAGKGIVPDDHELSLSAATVRPEGQRYIGTADVVLAVGTELAETDSFIPRLDIPEDLIRIDIDPTKIDDLYPAAVGIVADAAPSAQALLSALDGHRSRRTRAAVVAELDEIRMEIAGNLTRSESRHAVLLEALRDGLEANTIFMGDICQLVYTGAFAMRVSTPKRWHYPAGFCTLGCGLPNAIGAKLAAPDQHVVCLAGDGGVMFTVQELIVAAELGIALPVVIWTNDGLKQIRDDMQALAIEPVGVDGRNPDFVGLAGALGCDSAVPTSVADAVAAVRTALQSDRPTVIVIDEAAPWLAPSA